MNNTVLQYKEIIAFHPGYYIKEIIDDMEITQEQFAKRLGITPKTVSTLVNGKSDISDDIARKLSIMLGSSVELWVNLQKEYDIKKAEIIKAQFFEQQEDIMQMIDYNYFVKVAKLNPTHIVSEKIQNICQFLKISNLNTLGQQDFLVNYRTGIKNFDTKHLINAQAWLQTALNFAYSMNIPAFDESKLQNSLPEIRSLTTLDSQTFFPILQNIFFQCGVAFVPLPHLRNSGINGAVKWFGCQNSKVLLAINNRRLYSDTFWFSLFHEIAHILQKKPKMVFIQGELQGELNNINEELENAANRFSSNYLIPPQDYKQFILFPRITDVEIIEFAQRINIHPSIVLGRLQHDGIIPNNHYIYLKTKITLPTNILTDRC